MKRALALVLGLAGTARADVAPFDADGDGDIDDADREIIRAAEEIEIVDKSAAQKAIESARAVDVVDTKVARERTADLGEVLARQQGLQVRRFGGLGSQTRFTLDGFSDDQVRFFLDGLPLELVGWGLGLANVPIELVQRVEIHRGVVPIALGADALGGAIDLVTDPSWVSRASASYELGSFGTHRATATARARDAATGLVLGAAMTFDRATNDYDVDVEIPDAEGRLQARTVPRFHDGYIASSANIEGGIIDRGAIRRALVRAFQTDSAKELQNDAVMSRPYGEVTYGEQARGLVTDIALERGGWRARIAGGVVRRYLDFRDVSTKIFDWTGAVVGERRIPGELGEATDQRIRQRAVFARVTLERAFGRHVIRIAAAPTLVHRTGTDFRFADDEHRAPLSAQRDLAQLVLGAELELHADALENIAFVKAYASWLDAEQLEPGFVFRPISRDLRRYGLGNAARYALTPQLAVKASYEWAIRLPSIDETFGNGILIRDNLDLAPERSHNANVSARYDTDTLVVEGTGFLRLADQLIVLIGGEQFTTYENVYAARTLGASASARWRPRGWLGLDGAVTYQDVRNASSDGAFGRFDGDRIPNRPSLLAAAGATVRTRLRGTDELAGFVQSRFVDEFYRGWESLGTKASKQTIPRQLTHGIGVTYAVRSATPLVVTLELQNATNETVYDSFGVQRPGRALFAKLSAEL